MQKNLIKDMTVLVCLSLCIFSTALAQNDSKGQLVPAGCSSMFSGTGIDLVTEHNKKLRVTSIFHHKVPYSYIDIAVAIKSDNTAVSWRCSGECVKNTNYQQLLAAKLIDIVKTGQGSFAALTEDGKVISDNLWSPEISSQLKKTKTRALYANDGVFLAATDAGFFTWGTNRFGNIGKVPSDFTADNVIKVLPLNHGWALLRNDGTAFFWRGAYNGYVRPNGESIFDYQFFYKNEKDLITDVQDIFSDNGQLFILKKDNSIIYFEPKTYEFEYTDRKKHEYVEYTAQNIEIPSDVNDKITTKIVSISKVGDHTQAISLVQENGLVISWLISPSKNKDNIVADTAFLHNVEKIVKSNDSFSILGNGAVLNWTHESSAPLIMNKPLTWTTVFAPGPGYMNAAEHLNGEVKDLFAIQHGFIAITENESGIESIVTWGDAKFIKSKIKPAGKIKDVVQTKKAVAIVGTDGSLSIYGQLVVEEEFRPERSSGRMDYKRHLVNVTDILESGVSKVYTTDNGFLVEKENGTHFLLEDEGSNYLVYIPLFKRAIAKPSSREYLEYYSKIKSL